jgi:DNA-binding PucR family transcriptional regulator
MKQSVLEQAEGCLRLAERAFEAICQAGQDRIAFQIHWEDFLVQWKRTYNRVQQASKDTPQEIQWFGDVNIQRRADSLLRWLFEARNDGEHGTDQSASHRGTAFEFTSHEKELSIQVNGDGSIFLDENGKPVFTDGGKRVDAVEIIPAESRLLDVRERDRQKIVPAPTSHLGQPMEPKPHVAADLGLKWLRALVITAGAMSKT